MTEVITCAVCNRAVYTTDVDTEGACVFCKDAEVVPADAPDIRPARRRL